MVKLLKNSFKVLYIINIFVILSGCSDRVFEDSFDGYGIEGMQDEGDIKPNGVSGSSIMSETRSEFKGFEMALSENNKMKTVIPDPKMSRYKQYVCIDSSEMKLDVQSFRHCKLKSIKKNNTVSLNLQGNKNEYYLHGLALANICGKEIKTGVTIYNRKKECIGDSLVLLLTEKESCREENVKCQKVVLAVLNYSSGKVHMKETGIAASDSWLQLHLHDLDGDGDDEILVSGVANKWTEWEVFSLDEDEITSIKSNYYEQNGDGSGGNYIPHAFNIKKDGAYKARVFCKESDFLTRFSVKKLFLESKNDQRTKTETWDEEDLSVEEYGKILDGYTCFDRIDSKRRIKQQLAVYYYGAICLRMDAFIEYDKNQKGLVIDEVVLPKRSQ